MSVPIQEVLDLIASVRTGVLATASDGKPFASLTSFAFNRKQGTLVFFLSGIARHTKNIVKFPFVSLLIESEREKIGHSLDRPRVTVSGKIARVDETKDSKRCEVLFIEQNPESKMLIQLRDFNFFVLTPEEVYYVKGFGSVSRFVSLKA